MTDVNTDLDPDIENKKDTRRAAWFNRRRSLSYKFIDRLSRITNGRIRSPYLRSTEAFYRSKDENENAQNRPSPDQHFETWGIWAVEVYTPATISSLLKGLEGLKPKSRGQDRDPAIWVRKQRNNPGSSFELYLSPPNSNSLLNGFFSELPDFASSASGTIWSATPSLTVVTMFFIPTADQRRRIESILRADHPTRIEPHGRRGAGISDPELERRRLIAEARADWSAQSSRWFTKRFPGLLSQDTRGSPTCELTVVDNLIPFSEQHGTSLDRRTLTALEWMNSTTFSPSSEGENDFYYAPFAGWDKGEYSYSLIAMTRKEFENQNTSGWGNEDDRFIYPIDRSFRPIIAQWAITRALSYYQNRIAHTRDLLADVVGARNIAGAVGRVREQTAECADAATVARDVVDSVANHTLRIYHAGLFHTKRHHAEDDRRMDIALRETLTDRGNTLVRDVAELNATLHAQAALLSAHANLRLQPWIILLAIVSTFAGAVAAITPAREILGWRQTGAQGASPSKPLVSPEHPSVPHLQQSSIHKHRREALGRDRGR